MNVPKIETEIKDNREAVLTVAVEPEMLEREMKSAARRIAKHVNIPGFRRGRAPFHIIQQHYGEDVIFEEALDPLGQNAYMEALKESELEPYAPGSLTDIQRDPLVLTFTVPLQPEVDLGNYRDVRLPFEEVEVSDEDVDSALDDLRDRQATLDPVERAIQMGDVAMLDIVGRLVRDEDEEAAEDAGADDAAAEEATDDEGADEDAPGDEAAEGNEEKSSIWLNREEVRVRITEEATYPVPGFPQEVVGMEAADVREFEMSFAEDDETVDETLRGKTLAFYVKVDEVYEYNAPELDDEFAAGLGEFETFEELKQDVRKQLETQAYRERRDEYLDGVFEQLLDGIATVNYPPVMVEEQIDHMLHDFDQRLQQQGLNIDEYRRLYNISEQQIREDLREEAERQIRRGLVLREVITAEELGIRDDEIESEIDTAVLPYGTQAALARQLFSSPEARRSIANQLLTEKALDRLVAIAKGDNPEIGEPEPPAEPEAEEQPADEVGAPADAPEANEAAEAPAAEAAAEEPAAEEAAADEPEDAPAEPEAAAESTPEEEENTDTEE